MKTRNEMNYSLYLYLFISKYGKYQIIINEIPRQQQPQRQLLKTIKLEVLALKIIFQV